MQTLNPLLGGRDCPLRASIKESPKGSLRVPVGFYFYRRPTLDTHVMSLIGLHYTHVALRLDDCVYEQSRDRPATWFPLEGWLSGYPPLAAVELDVDVYMGVIDALWPVGLHYQHRATLWEFLSRPVRPTAQNCLSGCRTMLRYLGRDSRATTPDQLYGEVLDLCGSLHSHRAHCGVHEV